MTARAQVADNRYDVAVIGLGFEGRLAVQELNRYRVRVAAIGEPPRKESASSARETPFDAAALAQMFPNATVFPGRPRLLGPTAIEVQAGPDHRIVQARATILTAPFGSPAHPVLRESARIFRYHQTYQWPILGKRVAVVGGSLDGLAVVWQTVRNTHSPVWLIEESANLAGEADPDMGRVVENFFSTCGIPVRKETRVVAYHETTDEVTLELEGPESGTLTVDQVIITGPRRPMIDGLGLEELPVEFNEDGFLVTDDMCRTRIPNLFAIGGIRGWPFHTEQVCLEAEMAADAVVSRQKGRIPRVFETGFWAGWDLCLVGVREVERVRCGLPLRQGWYIGPTFMGMHPDVLKVFVDEDEDLIVGGAAFGPYSSEYARRLAFCMEAVFPASYVAQGSWVGPGDHEPEDWHMHWTPIMSAVESVLGRRSED